MRELWQNLTYQVNKFFLPYQTRDAGTLKSIAAITMFIDHVSYAFLELSGPGWTRLVNKSDDAVLLDAVGRMIGRTAMPLYAFLLVEGYLHTRSRPRYLLRMLLCALLSQYPFHALFFPYDKTPHYNTLFTLSLGLLAIWLIDSVFMRYLGLASRQGGTCPAGDSIVGDSTVGNSIAVTSIADGVERGNPAAPVTADPWQLRVLQLLARGAIAAAGVVFCCVAATRAHTDYAYSGVLVVLVFYLFRNLRVAGVLISYLLLILYNRAEIYCAAAMVLIGCYNGKRGRQLQYFFYGFYPGHLLLLLILRRVILGF